MIFMCASPHFSFLLHPAGLNVISGSSYWRLTGTMGGVTGPEMRINTFESLLSYYVLHRTRSKRLARESLRKATWSILLWKNKMGIAVEAKPAEEKSIFNHTHSQTFTLPRQLSENEKPFMLCMSHLFGYFRIKPDNPELVQSLYFNVFMRAFSTLQVRHLAECLFQLVVSCSLLWNHEYALFCLFVSIFLTNSSLSLFPHSGTFAPPRPLLVS